MNQNFMSIQPETLLLGERQSDEPAPLSKIKVYSGGGLGGGKSFTMNEMLAISCFESSGSLTIYAERLAQDFINLRKAMEKIHVQYIIIDEMSEYTLFNVVKDEPKPEVKPSNLILKLINKLDK